MTAEEVVADLRVLPSVFVVRVETVAVEVLVVLVMEDVLEEEDMTVGSEDGIGLPSFVCSFTT